LGEEGGGEERACEDGFRPNLHDWNCLLYIYPLPDWRV